MHYRFVGGPWHNRHVDIRGEQHYIGVPMPRKHELLQWSTDKLPEFDSNYHVVQYKRWGLWTPYGARYFEYHVLGHEERTQHSGNDFRIDPPQWFTIYHLSKLIYGSATPADIVDLLHRMQPDERA